MSAIFLIGISLDLPVCISSGTDSLGLQCLFLIADRHLTWHHMFQIIFQIKLIHQHQSAIFPADLQSSGIYWISITTVHGNHPDSFFLVFRFKEHSAILEQTAIYGNLQGLSLCKLISFFPGPISSIA